MNAYQYAILNAANSLKPGEEGWTVAQQWKRTVIQELGGTPVENSPVRRDPAPRGRVGTGTKPRAISKTRARLDPERSTRFQREHSMVARSLERPVGPGYESEALDHPDAQRHYERSMVAEAESFAARARANAELEALRILERRRLQIEWHRVVGSTPVPSDPSDTDNARTGLSQNEENI